MTDNNKKSLDAKFLIVGSICLIIGITMILVWWNDVGTVFRGGFGILFALVGMYVLYSIKR